jgi:regulator-associated protein of mTOR
MKLLQSPEYKSLLVSIWASILAFDSSCQVDLVKDGALPHFIQHLTWRLNSTSTGGVTIEAAKERTLAAFILAVASHNYTQGQTECGRLNLAGTICALLSSYEAGENTNELDHASADATTKLAESHLPAPFRMWLCLCLANMVKSNPSAQNEAFSASVHSRLFARMKDGNADVRAAACCALGCLVEKSPEKNTPGGGGGGPSDMIPAALGYAPQYQGAVGPPQQPLVPQRSLPGNMVVPPGVSLLVP